MQRAVLEEEEEKERIQEKTELDGLVFGEFEGLHTPSWLRQRFE